MQRSTTPLGLLVALSMLFLPLVGGCSATAGGDDGELVSGRHSPIVNGQETTDYPATGMLLHQGQPSCTGTLVGSRTVLTAGHCVEQASPSSLSFAFGPSIDQIDTSIDVVDAVQHPDWDSQQLANDIAVVTLAQDAPVERVTMNDLMDASWVGRPITLVGYGVTDGPSQTGIGTKRMVDVTIDKVEATSLHYTTQQGKTACNGDSGGPAFVEENGNLVVVGVTSYGDQNCQEFGVYTRVDPYLDFIFDQIKKSGSDPNAPSDPNDPADPNKPSDPGCNGETWEGRCDGNTVIWCEGGKVHSIDCGACGFVPQAGFFDCVG